MSKKDKKIVTYGVEYASEVPFGGEMIPAGTQIGVIKLPEACNPAKIPDQFARRVLVLKPLAAKKKSSGDGEGGGDPEKKKGGGGEGDPAGSK